MLEVNREKDYGKRKYGTWGQYMEHSSSRLEYAAASYPYQSHPQCCCPLEQLLLEFDSVESCKSSPTQDVTPGGRGGYNVRC